VAGAWEAAKTKAAQERRKTRDERRGRGGAGGDPGDDQLSPRGGQELRHESSLVARPRLTQEDSQAFGALATQASFYTSRQQQQQQQAPWQQQAPAMPRDDGQLSAAAAQEIARWVPTRSFWFCGPLGRCHMLVVHHASCTMLLQLQRSLKA
jgi:hypothetical protein